MVVESVVGADVGLRPFGMLHDELAHGLGFCVGDNGGLDLIRGSIIDPGHGGLAHGSPASSGQSLPLFNAHVPALPAEVNHINLHGPVEGFPVAGRLPGFADAMEHKPRGGLDDSDIPMQLHGTDTLKASDFQVDRHGPLAQWNLGVGQSGSGAVTEINAAFGARVGHLPLGGRPGSDAPAVAAASLLRPIDRLEPTDGGSLVGEHLQQSDECQSFAVDLAGCLVTRSLHHEQSLIEEKRVVNPS